MVTITAILLIVGAIYLAYLWWVRSGEIPSDNFWDYVDKGKK